MTSKPYRQEIHWVPENKRVELDREPRRVWTWILPEKPELPVVPGHLVNCFMEDRIHDWKWHKGVLRYFSRVRDHSVYIICEYESHLSEQ